MTTSDSSRFPFQLMGSGVPRWSHRDPVECGNPFSRDDPRHAVWEEATARAHKTLTQFDAELETDSHDTQAEAYPVRLVGLAVARFDTWARRGLAVVMSTEGIDDYETWLTNYERHWLEYVAETCPHVDVDKELRHRLAERVESWLASARTRREHEDGDGGRSDVERLTAGR